MMPKRNCSAWRTDNPIGKLLKFTKDFTKETQKNVRRYESIWEDTVFLPKCSRLEKPRETRIYKDIRYF